MDHKTWIVVISATASSFFALVSFSLRSFSRARLEELFESRPGGSRWQERLEKRLGKTAYARLTGETTNA